MTDRRQRVGAYALSVDESTRLLLCRMSKWTRTPGLWTLPGGGVQHGEEPSVAVLRELAEETGLRGEVERLLGVHTNVYEVDGASIHGVRLLYGVGIIGGSLQRESNDTTDAVDWIPLTTLDRNCLSAHARHAVELLG